MSTPLFRFEQKIYVMQAIKRSIIIPSNHKVHLDLVAPESIPPGETEVLVVFQSKQKAAPPKRKLGILEGQVWMSDDFDEPLPDTFWLGERE